VSWFELDEGRMDDPRSITATVLACEDTQIHPRSGGPARQVVKIHFMSKSHGKFYLTWDRDNTPGFKVHDRVEMNFKLLV
jgi:hypothetical protein